MGLGGLIGGLGGIVGGLIGGPGGAVIGNRLGGLAGGLIGGNQPPPPPRNIIPPSGGGGPLPGQPGGFVPGFDRTSCCQPGQECSGWCGGGVCIGRCRASSAVQTIVPPSYPVSPGPGALPPPPPQQAGSQNGCGCNGGGSCCLPNGRKGRTNKSRYRTLDGTLVEPGTRCVTPRRSNYANGKAAVRAVRRLDGTMRLMRNIERSISRIAPKPRRSSSKKSSRAACACG